MTFPLLGRRALLGTVAVGATASVLSGCSTTSFTQHKWADRYASDRALVTHARDLSAEILSQLGTASWAASARSLHTDQISEFETVAHVMAAAIPAASATPITQAALPAREQSLSRELRAMALTAQSGDVAMLLGCAAAGIDQLVTKGF